MEYKQTGYWWFISEPAERFHGTLTFDPQEGGSLVITVPKKIAQSFWGKNKLETIHGKTISGRKVSLFNCYKYRSSVPISEQHGTLKVIVNRILDGFHLPSLTDNNIISCSVSFNSLNEWVGNPGIEVNYIQSTRDFDIFCRKPAKTKFEVSNGLSITIEIPFLMVSDPSCFRGETTLSSYYRMKIDSSEPKSCIYFFNLIGILQDFFTIASLTYTIPYGIQLVGDFNSQINGEEANALYAFSSSQEAKPPEHPKEMLFQFKDTEGDISKILGNWIQKASLLKPVISLYCTGVYSPNLYPEAQFLNLIQAAEVFHRRFRGGTYINPEAYEIEWLPKIQDSIPPDLPYREPIFEKLKYLNEFSLPKRLKDLFKENKAIVKLFNLEKPEKMTKKISGYRNYLTHYANEKDNLEVRKVVECVNVLRLILEMSFLREMGFSEDKINELIKRNEVYSFLVLPRSS